MKKVRKIFPIIYFLALYIMISMFLPLIILKNWGNILAATLPIFYNAANIIFSSFLCSAISSVFVALLYLKFFKSQSYEKISFISLLILLFSFYTVEYGYLLHDPVNFEYRENVSLLIFWNIILTGYLAVGMISSFLTFQFAQKKIVIKWK